MEPQSRAGEAGEKNGARKSPILLAGFAGSQLRLRCPCYQVSLLAGYGERAARLTILAKLAILAIFCQFRQISSSIGIDTTWVNIGDFGDFDKFGNFGDVCQFRQISSSIGIYTTWVNIGVWTKSAILAIFCQFRQISSSIGIYTTRVNIGDFDKFGNYSCHFTVRLTTLFTRSSCP